MKPQINQTRNLIYNALIYKNLSPLFDMIDFPYVIIKGETLSLQAYGELGCRNNADIDFLLSKRNLPKLETLLNQCGFYVNRAIDRRSRIVCTAFSHQLPPFKKTLGKINLYADVNFDVFWGEYDGVRIELDNFLEDYIELNLYGQTIHTLTPEKHMIQIVLHHYKEMNSLYHLSAHNSIRYPAFQDIYKMILFIQETVTPDYLFSLCEKYAVSKFMFYMLYYTHIIFKEDVLQEYLKPFWKYNDPIFLNRYGLSSLEWKQWKIPFELRLDNPEVVSLVKQSLSSQDKEKIEREKFLFG